MTRTARLFFLLAVGFALNVQAQYDMDEIFGAADAYHQPNVYYATWCEDDKVMVPTSPTTGEVVHDCSKISRTPICREKWSHYFGSYTVKAYCSAK